MVLDDKTKDSTSSIDATKNIPDKTADITYYTKVKNPSSTNEKSSESGKFAFLKSYRAFILVVVGQTNIIALFFRWLPSNLQAPTSEE